jgi:hypothetical protein
MSKKTKIIAALLLVAVLSGIGVYSYVFYGGARDVATEESVYTVTTAELTQEFTADAQKANAKYNNKTINICGMATASALTEIKIDEVVSCSFTSAAPQIPANQKTTIKGRFVGYDELFGEFKLDQCTLTIPNN